MTAPEPPQADLAAQDAALNLPLGMPLRNAALRCLQARDPSTKAAMTRALAALWCTQPGAHPLDTLAELTEPEDLPGRPERPRLVPPKDVPIRSAHTAEGRAGLLHAIAHIEFNAINLALDAVWRFPAMPADYYRDWLRVAHEEAIHFGLLTDHLAQLGHRYGDFDAHDGLWLMARRTAGDVLARMALVPRTLEARGLDATPPLQAKLAQAGDDVAVAILGRILTDEVGHVAIGNRWYHWLCLQQGLEPLSTYRRLARAHQAPRLRPPYNVAARLAAGFTDAEIARLDEAPGTGTAIA